MQELCFIHCIDLHAFYFRFLVDAIFCVLQTQPGFIFYLTRYSSSHGIPVCACQERSDSRSLP